MSHHTRTGHTSRRDLRIGDDERSRVAGRLGEHYAAGRLTTDELDERLSRVAEARTAGDLWALQQDLPRRRRRAVRRYAVSGMLAWQMSWIAPVSASLLL